MSVVVTLATGGHDINVLFGGEGNNEDVIDTNHPVSKEETEDTRIEFGARTIGL